MRGQKINIEEKINMGNYKSPSQDCLEEKKDKLSIDSPNRFYLDNIITA